MPRVLYLGGTGRTGSTVLDAILGEFPGVVSGGELAYLWSHGLGLDGRCSCRCKLAECPYWTAVFDAGFGGLEQLDPPRMVALRRRFWSGHLPTMLIPGGGRRGLRRLEEFPSVVERLYRSMACVAGAEVIVDSSKEPHYSYLLREGTDLDVYFLHLVRDPRAVGHAWRKHRREPGLDDGGHMARRGPAKASLYYTVSNVAAEMLWRRSERYAFLRYEDFVADPQRALHEIARFVGQRWDVDAVVGPDGAFERTVSHSAWGNPNRFQTGRTVLRADAAWERGLRRDRRAALSLLNAPVSSRYGYEIVGAGRRRPVGGLRRRMLVGADA